MAEIVGGLFGVTPESLQAQREAALAQQAQQYAQLSPMQVAQAGFYTAGNRLAGAAGGLMGAQDPEMMRIQQRQQLLKDANIQTPQGLKELSLKLYQAGDYSGAQQALAQAQAQETAQVKQMHEGATATKAMAETQDILGKQEQKKSRVQMLLDAGKTEAEANAISSNDAAFAKYIENKQIATPAEYAVQAQSLGFGAKPYLSDYSPEQVKAMEKGVFSHKAGIAQAGAAKSNTQIIQQQESEFAKTMGKEQAGMLTKALEQAQTSSQALDRLATMEKTTGNVYSGPQANTAIAASQLLSSLDLLSPTEAKRLSNSEVYAKSAKDLVMKDLGGKLGAGISNADRAYIEERIPQLQNSAPARIELINKLKEIHSLEIKKAKDMQAYAAQKGSLNGFDVTAYGMTKGTPPSASPTTGGWSIKVKQ